MNPYYQDDWVTLYHGDCLEIMPQLGQVDHVITDPPYGLMQDNNKIQLRGGAVSLDYGDWDRKVDYKWIAMLPGVSVVTFHDQKQATVVQDELVNHGWRFRQYLFWDKGDSGMTPRRNFVNSVEMASFATRGDYVWNGRGSTKNIFRINRAPTPLHPTQKPLGLMKRLVFVTTAPRSIVLDPFAGSGTTLRAAKELGRKAIGIEINEEYCEVIAERMAQDTLPFVEHTKPEQLKL